MSVPSVPLITPQPFASDQALEFHWYPPAETNGELLGYQFLLNNSNPVILSPGANYYKVVGLSNNVDYTGQLAASNINGYGPSSNFITFRPGPAVPDPPATFTASYVDSNSAILKWTPPATAPVSDILWYAMYADSKTQPQPELSFSASGQTQNDYIVRGLSTNTDYEFSIYSVNCPGWSPPKYVNYSPFFPGTALSAYGTTGQVTYEPNSYFVSSDTDTNGNFYITFMYFNTISIYNYNGSPTNAGAIPVSLYGSLSNNSSGSNDIALVKYNPMGNVQWVVRIGGALRDRNPKVHIDSNNNIYITGFFESPQVNITNRGDLSGTTIIPNLYGFFNKSVGAAYDIFLAKYNSSGFVQWATIAYSHASINNSLDITTDISGNVYVINLRGSNIYNFSSAPVNQGLIGVQLYGTIPSTTLSPRIRIPMYITKYSPSGSVLWGTVFGVDNESVSFSDTKLSTDSSGNVYAAFRAFDIMNFYSYASPPVNQGPVNLTYYGFTSITGTFSPYIVKYNADGIAQWAVNVGSTAQIDNCTFKLDNSGNPCIAIRVATNNYTLRNYSTGPSTPSNEIFMSNYGIMNNATTNSSLILCKYNPNGKVIWATNANGTASIRGTFSLDIDINNNIYFTCTADHNTAGSVIMFRDYASAPINQGTIGLSNYGTMPTLGTSGTAILVAKYNSLGSVQWATKIDANGGSSDDWGANISVDYLGNAYVSGGTISSNCTIYTFSSAPNPLGSTIGIAPYGTVSNIRLFTAKYKG